MSPPRFSPKSLDDLAGILDYISRDNRNAGVRFVEVLRKKCQALAQFPEMGARRDELSPGLRAFAVHNYVIYYTTHEEAVRIERVLHGAQDRDAIFEEET